MKTPAVTSFVVTFLLAIVFTCCVVSSAASSNNNNNHWVLFNIDKSGRTTIIAARAVSSETPTSPCMEEFPSTTHGKNKAYHKRLVVVSYSRGDNSKKDHQCHVAVKDPRLQWHDAEHPTKGHEGHFHGNVQKLDSSTFAIVISTDVTHLQTVDLTSSSSSATHHRHKIEQAHFRAAETLATDIDSTKVNMKTHQLVGTTTEQRNMVFLASGYTAAEQSKFDADVQKAMTFLQQSSNQVSSMPYFRYFSTWNFFSVFHPSENSGASKPAPAGSGYVSDNVLDCSYDATSGRILSCNRPRVLVLASYAPPDPSTSVTVVLVNDVVFGGTGGSGICTVYTGDRLSVVLIHEIGHAFADLSDEYSYETSEPNELDLINCHWDPVVAVPWRDWIDAKVIGEPEPICTYNNYYKPTPDQCLMERDYPQLCPVCKEATVRTMYGQIGTIAPGGLNLAAPRFPSEHDTIIVKDTTDNATLWMNDRINSITDNSGTFSTKWRYNGTIIAENVSSLTITNTAGGSGGAIAEWVHPGVGSYELTLEIVDHTNMLLAADRNIEYTNTSSKKSMRQFHPYKIKIVADTSSCADQNGTIRNNTHGGQYCGVCQSGYESECSLNVSARPLAGVADVSGSIPELEGWLIGLGIGFVVLGAIAFYFTFKTMEQHAEENVGEILPLSQTLIYLRYALLVSQAILLLVATFVIMYTAYMFIVVSIFGRPVVLGICITSCFVWFFSFVGFTGAYFNNRTVVFSSFILSIWFVALTLVFTGMLLHTQTNVDSSEDVFLQLRADWRATVENDAEAACKMQKYLYCSGWDSACDTRPGPSSDCPKQCELANQIAYPCWPKVQTFVSEHFYNAAVGGIVLAVFLIIIMVLSVVFGCGMKLNRAKITKQRYARAQDGRNTLTDNELGMLRNEFRKVDKKKTGEITRDQFAKFYSRTMGVKMNKDQLQEYFDALDVDQSGTLSFEEFVKIYMPAVDISQDQLEREKQQEDARLQERKRLLNLVDENGKPRTDISPAASNIDPLAVAAVREELENEQQRKRLHDNTRRSFVARGTVSGNASRSGSDVAAASSPNSRRRSTNISFKEEGEGDDDDNQQQQQHQSSQNSGEEMMMMTPAHRENTGNLEDQIVQQQQEEDHEEPSEEHVILVDSEEDDE